MKLYDMEWDVRDNVVEFIGNLFVVVSLHVVLTRGSHLTSAVLSLMQLLTYVLLFYKLRVALIVEWNGRSRTIN
jgi:hypothetical protein